VGVDGKVVRFEESRGLLSRVLPSPDGAHAVVSRVERPFSRLAPARLFPSVVEVWDLAGRQRVYASSARGVGVEDDEVNDPRRFAWLPGKPTQLGWIEPTTGDGEVWLALAEPFATADPRIVAQSPRRIRAFAWTTEGTPLYVLRTQDDDSEVFVVREDGAHLFWKGRSEDRYGDPGRAIREGSTSGPILEHAGRIFLAGEGLGPSGPRPFLEAVDLGTFETERIFTSSAGVFEEVVGVLDPSVPTFVTARETEVQAPELFKIRGETRTLLRSLPDPYPALAAAERRRITYLRDDGVELRATLYLPAGRTPGEPLPTFIYIYPREFTHRDYAEQIDVRHYRFHQVEGASPLAAVLNGYAVLTHPRMPIIGEGSDVNDAYLDQLAANARAAIDHLVELGVSDPKRVAIGGHSYGAFSAANLLVHSDLFATGIAISGAYNRTLTPFGFQSEKRSLWEAADFYIRMSPFFYVDQLRVPILIMHGGSDPNPGTPVLQAHRFFHALVGVGAHARYVELPFEAHRLRARESILHTSAEMMDWLDRTIGADAEASSAEAESEAP
jgi:dipeptidyl aminopeptidase/acylaminoacyl peptidase